MTTTNSSRTLYIDLEMLTGTDKRIIQIGIVEIDTENLVITREENFYVRPYGKYHLDWFCQKLTGINNKILTHWGKPMDEIIGKINKFGPKNKITFAWGTDEKALRKGYNEASFIRKKEFEFPFQFIDLGWMFRCILKQKNPVGLSKALVMLGLEFEGTPHNALHDAKNTARIHMELLRRMRMVCDCDPLDSSNMIKNLNLKPEVSESENDTNKTTGD